jgi:uncharacterized protein YdeI (YjbR/CyaY-like superfamily)
MVVPAFHSPRSSKQVVSGQLRQVERLRAQGKLTAAGFEQMEAAKSDGRWAAAYAPQRTIIVPDDLRAALAASPIARKFFESLAAQFRNEPVRTVNSCWKERPVGRLIV